MREENSGYANDCYRSAIERFGGEVIECNYHDHYEDLLGILSVVDGVLLTGGDDASIMGLFIINYCVRNNKRLLGICLGMQEMCVYSSNENISFVIYGENFTYENAPDIIKKEYLDNCVALGISPKPKDEIFVPLNISKDLNINTYSSSEYYSISYHDNYIQVKGSKNYSININTTYVGYNHTTSGNAVHCL